MPQEEVALVLMLQVPGQLELEPQWRGPSGEPVLWVSVSEWNG